MVRTTRVTLLVLEVIVGRLIVSIKFSVEGMDLASIYSCGSVGDWLYI